MTRRPTSLERALEEAVSRALRDNLAPLQRTADELQVAYADLVAACSSTRPSNALPAMVRAQTAASSLAAGLAVLSNFVAVALNSREQHGEYEADEADENSGSGAATAVLEHPEEAPADVASETVELASEHVTEKIDESPEIASHIEAPVESHDEPVVSEHVAPPEAHAEFQRRDCGFRRSRAASGSSHGSARVRSGKSANRSAGSASPREPCSQSCHARHPTIKAQGRSPGP